MRHKQQLLLGKIGTDATREINLVHRTQRRHRPETVTLREIRPLPENYGVLRHGH